MKVAAVPQVLGRYDLLFPIGAGGMARVFAARLVGEAGFQKLVAVKVMLPELADDADCVRMFLDEARIAASVRSPHVVSTLDLGRSDEGMPFIVMELVIGASLRHVLRDASAQNERVPMPALLEVVAQAARGLHDAHEATNLGGEPLRIVHRDVSPENILLGTDGQVRLTDFGVARAMQRDFVTTSGGPKGKYAYFSPEQASGGDLDRRSDIFALGVVAWEALAGTRLFRTDSPVSTLQKILSYEIPDLQQVASEVPREVADVVAGALRRSREERFATADELHEALRRAMDCSVGRTGPGDVRVVVRRYGAKPIESIEQGVDAVSRVRGTAQTLPAATVPEGGAAAAARVGARREEVARGRKLRRWLGPAALIAAVAVALVLIGIQLSRAPVERDAARTQSPAAHRPSSPARQGAPVSASVSPHPPEAVAPQPAPSTMPATEVAAEPPAGAPRKVRTASPIKRPPVSPRATPEPVVPPRNTPETPRPTGSGLAGVEDFDRDIDSD